jgi:quercetin dioxygenase-like cupin family protein
MKRLILTLTLFMLIASATYTSPEIASAQGKESQFVYRAESQKSFKGPEDLFTGDVQVDMLFPDNETAQYSGAYVTFQPGARTNWHWHPAGQHMIVTNGIALTGTRDGKIIEFHEGETVWCPPELDHWHGATPDASMTHLVITGSKDGKAVIWKEKVTDKQYMKQ